LAGLAEVVYESGRLEEAGRLAEEAAALATADDVISHAAARSVRGRVAARRGAIAEGERLTREAVALTDPTDFVDQKASVLLGLADVLELAERRQEAMPLIEKALELARQKGNVLLARRVTQRLSSAEPERG
jgi:tetratricopeptide (TPR) repeat protein